MLIMKIRIAIDLTPLYNRKWTGVELYAIDLYRALLSDKMIEVIPIFNTINELDDNKNAYIIKKCNRFVLENFNLSRAVRKINSDIVLFPIFPPPIDLYLYHRSKLYPVIHDTVFLRYFSTLKFAAKYYLYPKYKLALKKADAIVTISVTSGKQLKEYTSQPIINCGENISSNFFNSNLKIDISCLEKYGLKSENYYISVSTIEPRKNLKYTLKVLNAQLKKSCMKLVLVGRRGWGCDDELKQLIVQMSDRIIFTEYVPDETLQSLYHHAYAFILLSLDEGFGRTPLEAIACGCKRVIVSDIEIFHETLMDSATYLPLNNVNEAKKIIMNTDKLVLVNPNFDVPFNVLEHNVYKLRLKNI